MTVEPTHTASKEMAPRFPATNYHLKSEVSNMLHCQLCSIHYTALSINNCSKSASAIEVATMKNTDDFCYKGKPSHATDKSTPFAVSQDEWDTKEDHEECIVHTVVCQKAPIQPKQKHNEGA